MESGVVRPLTLLAVLFVALNLACPVFAETEQERRDREAKEAAEILDRVFAAPAAVAPAAPAAAAPSTPGSGAPCAGNSSAKVRAAALVASADDAQAFAALCGSGLSAEESIAAFLSIRNAEEKAKAAGEAAGKDEGKKEEAQNKFLGFDWSAGIGVTYDLESEPRIDSAKVVNGTVRVEEESRSIPRVVLETHYLFGYPTKENGDTRGRCKDDGDKICKGHGPFVAVQSSDKKLLESFATGYMFGWRRDSKQTWGFNVGLGVALDPSVQVLGDGIKADQALPTGETEVRFKKVDRWGGFLMFSFTF